MIEVVFAILFVPFSALLFYSNLSKSSYKTRNYNYAFFVFILLFVISGFRNIEIGNDSLAYNSEFNDLEILGSFWKIEGRLEPGYQYLCKFIKIYLSDKVNVLFIITSLFIQFFFVRFMYLNSKKLWLSVFLFISFQYYFFFVSAIRQAIAQVICLIAYEYLKKDKLKYFFGYILLAFTFHYSSLIFAILPLFRKLKFTFKKVLVSIVIASFLFVVLTPVLQYIVPSISYGTDYLDGGVSDDLSTRLASILLALMSFLIVLFAFKFNYHKNAETNVCVRFELWCSLISLFIGVLAIKFGILIRFTYYFGLFSIVMIPNIISTIQNSKMKNIMTKGWFIITFVNICVILYNRPEWFNFYPYKFYWEK